MMQHYYAAALKYFTNTKDLKIGDVVVAFPEPIDKLGNEYRIRRAMVINRVKVNDEIKYISLLDLDNNELFVWDYDCEMTNKNYVTFLVD